MKIGLLIFNYVIIGVDVNMLGYKHFKFEQYKLWCKNHNKKASQYVNFKTFIELYGGVN